MEIICNQNELNNAIQLVSKAVASRPLIQFLQIYF